MNRDGLVGGIEGVPGGLAREGHGGDTTDKRRQRYCLEGFLIEGDHGL